MKRARARRQANVASQTNPLVEAPIIDSETPESQAQETDQLRDPGQPAEGDLGASRAEQAKQTLGECRIEQRALRERWPIPHQYREGLVLKQIKIALAPDSTPREAASAFRCLLGADHVNLEVTAQERTDLVEELLKRLEAIYEISPEARATSRNGYAHRNGVVP
jgi:hypothetical protein